MPARMNGGYLRHLFPDNDFAAGRWIVDNRPSSPQDVRPPLFFVSTETDHVSPWRSVFAIHHLTEGEGRLVLTHGGHKACLVSSPDHPRRRFRIRTHRPGEAHIHPDAGVAAAVPRTSSWWGGGLIGWPPTTDPGSRHADWVKRDCERSHPPPAPTN